MKPAWYMDLRVAAEMTSRGPSGTAITVLARTLHLVHAIGQRQGIVFASAFPQMRTGDLPHPGQVLRLFTSERAECDTIADEIDANGLLAGYLSIGRVRPVPQGVPGAVTYRRFRISSKRAVRPEHRLRRLAEGDRLPYLVLASQSTGQRFSLRIDCARTDGPASDTCQPDSYGLAVATRAFSLPDLPSEAAPWQHLRAAALQPA